MKSAVSEVTPEDLKSFPLNRRESLNPGNQKKQEKAICLLLLIHISSLSLILAKFTDTPLPDVV